MLDRVVARAARALRKARRLPRFYGHLLRLRLRLRGRRVHPPAPRSLVADVDDDTWLWLHTDGVNRSRAVRELLAGMPDDVTQIRFTGSAGRTTLREAFRAYRLFSELFRRHVGSWSESTAVLDFGCGWGRTIRFFLRDVEPSNLWGVDCFPEAIEICKRTNSWSTFALVDPMPPTELGDETFDLIYSYSVFSHLSEEAHLRWLEEFRRILRPGGLVIATTWQRDYIETAEERHRQRLAKLPPGYGRPAVIFPDTEGALRDYDSGRYCHSAVGGGGPLDSSFYGETCISEAYVLQHWTALFDFVTFIDDRARCPQNVIAVRKTRVGH
jgi:SAM-dependent methyltransferase